MLKIGNTMWSLPLCEEHQETVAFDLVKLLNRRDWGLRDINEVSNLIELNPPVKEVVLSLIEIIKTTKAEGKES